MRVTARRLLAVDVRENPTVHVEDRIDRWKLRVWCINKT